MRISVILAVSVFAGLSTVAIAQQSAAKCLCILASHAGSPIAAVEQVQGQVLVSGTVGYMPIQSSAGLSAGDRVVLLDDGRAVLTGPACRVALAADSTISLVPAGTGICVAQATTISGALPGTLSRALPVGPPLTGAPTPGQIVAGGLVTSGVAMRVIGAVSGGDVPTPVSP